MTIHNGQHKRADADFYPTLDAGPVVRILLDHFDLRGAVWEPQAGAGHLVKALRDNGLTVHASDLHARPVVPGLDVQIETGRDFLKETRVPEGVGTIVMNPPYGRDIDNHIRHALTLAEVVDGLVVVLARSDMSYAKCRQNLFRAAGFVGKIELGWRLRWAEGTTMSGKHNYALYVWDTGIFARAFATISHGYR